MDSDVHTAFVTIEQRLIDRTDDIEKLLREVLTNQARVVTNQKTIASALDQLLARG